MKRAVTFSVCTFVGCANVIGADFGEKTLDASGVAAGGSAGSAGSSGSAGTAGSAGSSESGDLVINEICATAGLTFVELYNGSDQAVDLGDFRLLNHSGSAVLSDPRTLSGTLASGAYFVSADDCGTASCAMNFDAAGDILELRERGSGNARDLVHYPGAGGSSILKDGESYARLPDGAGNFAAGTPTRGKPNLVSAP